MHRLPLFLFMQIILTANRADCLKGVYIESRVIGRHFLFLLLWNALTAATVLRRKTVLLCGDGLYSSVFNCR